MRKLALVLAVTILVALTGPGCKRPGSQKLEGHWKGVKSEGVPPTAQLLGDTFAQGTEIFAQGTQLTIVTGAGRSTAQYVIDKEDPTTLVVHTDRDSSPETFSFNDKADVMTWKVDAQRSITFRKMQ